MALAIAEGKIRNQVNLLKYMSKNRKEKEPEIFEAVRSSWPIPLRSPG
ncbi:MAG: hypothetical protein R3E79_47370 [Caldilineaceae bacterium]